MVPPECAQSKEQKSEAPAGSERTTLSSSQSSQITPASLPPQSVRSQRSVTLSVSGARRPELELARLDFES